MLERDNGLQVFQSAASKWKEKLDHAASASCYHHGVGALCSCRCQGAEIPDNGTDRYMFFSICRLSRQHGLYQPNNRQLAWNVFDWMVRR
jgi:hypothetical protein